MELEVADCRALSPVQVEAWLELFESAKDARFYQHPHWFQCISEHLNSDKLNIAFVYVGTKLQLVVPLCDAKGARRRAHPAHDHLSLNDILFHPDLGHQPEQLFSYLNAALNEVGESWLDWQITNVPHFSPLVQALSVSNQSPVQIDEQAATPSLRIARDNTIDHWMMKKTRQSASFDCSSESCPPHGKLKRNLRRLRKQISEVGELRVDQIVEPAQLPNALEHFLHIEASGWKGQGHAATAISVNPELQAFYSNLLSPDLRGITPEINLLWSNDQCIAAQFGLRTNKCLSLLKIGYNDEFARFSPGYLLLESVLADAPARGIETLSLVTSPPWADRWHPDTAPVWHVNRYSNSTLGSAMHQMDKLKQLAKSRLRTSA